MKKGSERSDRSFRGVKGGRKILCWKAPRIKTGGRVSEDGIARAKSGCAWVLWLCMGPLAVTISHETLSSTTSQYSVLKFLRNFACNSTVRYARFTEANSTADNKGCCRNQELAPRDPRPPLTVSPLQNVPQDPTLNCSNEQVMTYQCQGMM